MPDPVNFIFVCCQFGAEKTCKQELLTRYSGLRLAFSRPGFMTFKVTEPGIRPGNFKLKSTFARVWGWSLGKEKSDDTEELTKAVATQIISIVGSRPLTNLHCWQRDLSLPGRQGFEPGISPVAKVSGQMLQETLKQQWPDLQLNGTSQLGEQTVCVVMVEPNEWWIGSHDASTIAQCWPGGAPPIELPPHAASRAWLKIHEAVLWGGVSMQKGDVVAEIGSSPGGASQYLLERGATVIAIDPAEMDAAVVGHPSLKHVRRRARDVPKRDLKDVRWLTIDINMPPSYTIEVIRDYVEVRGLPVRGIIATLKLPDWKLAEQIDTYRQQFEAMGFGFVDTRQLAFNRQELCVVALRKRGTP
jgi:23S rRNA (cytidine2498-2'-O)-methyltransferase